PRGLGVDDELELARLHHRQVRRLRALEDATGVDPHLSKCLSTVGAIAHQPAGFGVVTRRICRGNFMQRCQVNQLDTPAAEKGVRVNNKGVGPLPYKSCESRIDFAACWR